MEVSEPSGKVKADNETKPGVNAVQPPQNVNKPGENRQTSSTGGHGGKPGSARKPGP